MGLRFGELPQSDIANAEVTDEPLVLEFCEDG